MIITLAGRRIDPGSASEPRFPPQNASRVQHDIYGLLKSHQASLLVSSAACGADILALDAAGMLDIRRRVVLPFSRTEFRKSSVVDRGDEWGSLYDKILDDVESKGDLILLEYRADDEAAYPGTNVALFDQAQHLSGTLHQPIHAV